MWLSGLTPQTKSQQSLHDRTDSVWTKTPPLVQITIQLQQADYLLN